MTWTASPKQYKLALQPSTIDGDEGSHTQNFSLSHQTIPETSSPHSAIIRTDHD